LPYIRIMHEEETKLDKLIGDMKKG
jgi:hypothetical protein